MVRGLSVSSESTTWALEPSGMLILDFAIVDFSTAMLDEVPGRMLVTRDSSFIRSCRDIKEATGRGVGRGRRQLVITRIRPTIIVRVQSVRPHHDRAFAVATVAHVSANVMAARTRPPQVAPFSVRSSRASSENGPSA